MGEMSDVTKALVEHRLIGSTSRLGIEGYRSNYQRGWNAAMSSIDDRRIAIEAWYRTLTPERSAMFAELLAEGPLDIDEIEGKIQLSSPCSDMFMWGSSDCEVFTLDELSDYHAA